MPDLDAAFLKVVGHYIGGDPMQEGVLWTNLSRPKIAEALAQQGCRVSVTVVDQLLTRHRLGRRSNHKSLPLGRHPQRNRQFEIITRYREQYADSPNPILSIDTKAKEFLGLLFRAGKLYTQKAARAYDHDYPSSATGVIYPHGIYDCKRNLGHLHLGVSHDTSRFACDSMARWWEHYGQKAYPDAKQLLFLCAGGGSNSSRRHIFKHLLEQLASRIQLEIRVAHYPPYCSKFNPIEHRFFPHVTEACRGLLLTSLEVVRAAMEKTRTKPGLKTTVDILEGEYPLKEKAPKDYRESTKIVFDDELSAWNYCAIPGKWGSY
jgi:hypothetical protein